MITVKINLNTKQSQSLFLSTELKNAIELLALNSLELIEYINKEAVENVVLDFTEEESPLSIENFAKEYRKENYFNKDDEILSDVENKYENYTFQRESLYDFLVEQLRFLELKKTYLNIGYFLIENIDDRGYLQGNINQMAKDLNVDVHDVYFVLKKIQSFEPKGIGARNLKECLLAQTEDDVTRKIIDNHLEDIAENRIRKIAKILDLSLDEVYKYIDIIKQLSPCPSDGFSQNSLPTQYIVPEILVTSTGDQLEVVLKNDFEGKLHLNDYYLSLIENSDDETKKYLSDKLKRAMFLIDSIKLRQENIKKVVETIVQFQKPFFLYDTPLSPLNMKTVARASGVSESTVSRVTDNKYLQCSKGVFSLKFFFITALGSKDGNVSSDFLIKEIEELILKENKEKPLSDQKIADILNKEGHTIKRRTVAKYREQLNILSSTKRKKIV